jgi:amidase
MLLKDLGCHVAGEQTNYGTAFLRDAHLAWPTDSHLAARFRARGWSRWAGRTCPSSGRP